jgi:hypothetical protein
MPKATMQIETTVVIKEVVGSIRNILGLVSKTSRLRHCEPVALSGAAGVVEAGRSNLTRDLFLVDR